MDAWLAVIDDLFRFAYSSLFGAVSTDASTDEKFSTHSMESVDDLLPGAYLTPVRSFKVGNKYYIAGSHAHLHHDPVLAFDASSGKLGFGQAVVLISTSGRWVKVEVNGHVGWVLKDVLVDDKSEIIPDLNEFDIYDSLNPETLKLRAWIDDEFFAGRASLLLSAAEYVTYRLLRDGKVIHWKKDAPRLPGTWQTRLRGQNGIYMNVLPSPMSVMEYVLDDVGHLAFVEEVLPERSIRISEVGNRDDGGYREVTLSETEYRELHPVFIKITS